jgi:ribosome biogenesis GTPase / thiamine phosphate phosphatase
VLAANVDIALLATSMNRDLNPRRLARFLAMTVRGAVEPVVLLTKSDLADDPMTVADHVHDALGGVPVLTVSARDGGGMGALRGLLAPRLTAVLLGSSGVGKSTLVNALLGAERRPTAPIRASDDRGRHTTARRELVVLPSGALLIDTPRLRLVAPLEDGDDPVPLVDRATERRERAERDRAVHRAIHRDMRERRRERERVDGRRG